LWPSGCQPEIGRAAAIRQVCQEGRMGKCRDRRRAGKHRPADHAGRSAWAEPRITGRRRRQLGRIGRMLTADRNGRRALADRHRERQPRKRQLQRNRIRGKAGGELPPEPAVSRSVHSHGEVLITIDREATQCVVPGRGRDRCDALHRTETLPNGCLIVEPIPDVRRTRGSGRRSPSAGTRSTPGQRVSIGNRSGIRDETDIFRPVSPLIGGIASNRDQTNRSREWLRQDSAGTSLTNDILGR